MQMNDDAYARLTDLYHSHLRNGRFDHASITLKEMAKVLDQEHKYLDELKLLMLAFHFDLSKSRDNRPFIDPELVGYVLKVVAWTGITMYDMEELYRDTNRPDTTPYQTLTVDDSFRLFSLCLKGKIGRASIILSRMV